MRISKLAATAFALTAAAITPHAGAAGVAQLHGEAGGTYFVPLTTLKEMRLRESFRTTVRQQHDFSCGSAALATLLTHHYGRPVREETVFRAMYEAGDQAKIQQHGFSLLDIKRYLEANGFEADGFEASLDQLADAHVPAIILIRENGYNHFVVVKGLRGAKVLIGDPSSGTRVLERTELEAMWVERILFVIRSHQNSAYFNVSGDWRVRLPAPLGEAISREGLAGAMLMMPTPKDF